MRPSHVSYMFIRLVRLVENLTVWYVSAWLAGSLGWEEGGYGYGCGDGSLIVGSL